MHVVISFALRDVPRNDCMKCTMQCQNVGKIFTGPAYKQLVGFKVIFVCLHILYYKYEYTYQELSSE